MTLPITEMLIQRQINNWNRLRQFLQTEEPEDKKDRGPVITVSRLTGSGGRTLAEGLAERLGLSLHDQSLMEKIAKDRDLEESLLAQMDENEINQANLWVKGILSRRIFLRDQFHAALVAAVTRLAARGGAVILGRGANLILGEKATLRIRLIASDANRIERIRHRLEISRAEARAILTETDRRRQEFIRQVFHDDAGRSRNFDLVINTDRISEECVQEQVLLALLSRQTDGRSTLREMEAEQ